MDNLDWVINLITSVGFPIFVALYLLWHGDKEEQTHKEEVKELAEALNNNTLVLQKIVDELNVISALKKEDKL